MTQDGGPDPRFAPQGQPWSQPWTQAQPGAGPSAQPPAGAPPDPDGFFTPLHVPRQSPPREGGFAAPPPPYGGPVYTREEQPAPSGPMGEAPDDRVVYRAPRRRRGGLAWLMVGLAALVLVLAYAAARVFAARQETPTAVVTISERGTTFSGQALIVRDETVFRQQNVADVRFVAKEGQAVTRGEPVCTVFTSGFSAREVERLQSYREQIKDYHKVLLAASIMPDSQLMRLETLVNERARETQTLVRGEQGNLLNQEQLLKDAITARHSYLKQKYIEDTKLTRLYDNENSQLQRIQTWTKQFAASDNGIVSFYTDGFETVLNPTAYVGYSPRQVRDMIAGKVPGGSERQKDEMDIFRLVRQYSWGVLLLADDFGWNPVVGDEYRMLIESFDSTTVRVKVDSVTKAGGEMLVRLTASSAVEPVLYVRQARVQLSKSVITYAVPASAVINQDGVIGVVVQYREGPYLVPVEVVSADATQAHVVPVNPGHLYEGLVVRLF
ncbi:MAG TPA: HlyD family efflux transporter periplasmic adaptor subunit [Candidatus Limnocylindria bacterium]|nr:HlyD family efflux transporter periplasmic adaptor subunit [Candidatus Limnocylindria bacterium]